MGAIEQAKSRASVRGASLAKVHTAPLLISCRSIGPMEAITCRSCHEAAGHVAVDRPLFRTLGGTRFLQGFRTGGMNILQRCTENL